HRRAHISLDLPSQIVELLASLFEPCIGFLDFTVNYVASKDRDRKRSAHVVNSRGVRGMSAPSPVIRIEGKRGEITRDRGFSRQFRCSHVGGCSTIVRTRGVCTS